MGSLLYILAVAFITRMDGWGPQAGDPAWQTPVAKSLGLYTCGGLVGFFTFLYTGGWQVPLIVMLGWMLWRAPAFKDYGEPDWKHWPEMFLRSTLTVAPCFIAMSLLRENSLGWLFIIPMGVAQVLLYNGIRRLAKDDLNAKIPYYQVIAEAGSGFVFASFVVIIQSA